MAGNKIGKCYGKKLGQYYAEGKVLEISGKTFEKIEIKGEAQGEVDINMKQLPCYQWHNDNFILKNVTKDITIEIGREVYVVTDQSWINDIIQLYPKGTEEHPCRRLGLYISTYYTD